MYSMQVTILPADSMITPYRVPILTLIGNPNTGKTTPFNAVTGLSQQFCNYPGVTVEHKVVTCTATRARGLGLAHRHGHPHPFSRPQGDHFGAGHHLQPRRRQGRRIREPARHLVLRGAYLHPARGAEIIVFFAVCAQCLPTLVVPAKKPDPGAGPFSTSAI